MINKINNLFIFIFFLFISCIKLLAETLRAICKIKEVFTDGSIWFAIFYQPFLVLIVISLFASKIDLLIYDFLNGKGNIVFAIILCAILIIIILVINSLIELLYRIIYKNGNFETFFSIQKYIHSYMMVIISLIAIYAAIDSYNATAINTTLLAYGILIFVCIIITDLYNAIYLSQGVVKGIYDNLQNDYQRHKK